MSTPPLPSGYTVDQASLPPLPPGYQLDGESSAPPSTGQRLRENFAEGLGITSDEAAKNFFTHPINTAIGMLQGQGQLALKAKQAYASGDYKGAVMYGLNYLLPFIGQQTAKAGEQLASGDIAGGVGRTLGAAVPIIAGSPEVRGATGSAASAALNVAKPAIAKAAGAASDIIDPDLTGVISPRTANIQRSLGKLANALQKSTARHADISAIDAESTPRPAPQGPEGFGPSYRTPVGTVSNPDVRSQPDTAPNEPTPTPTPRPAPQATPPLPKGYTLDATPDILRADRLETQNIQDQVRAQAEGQDRQALEEVARERLSARMPRKADRPDMGNLAATSEPKPAAKAAGTPADADLENLLQKSLAAVQQAKAAH